MVSWYHILTWFLFLVGAASFAFFQVNAIVQADNNTAKSRVKVFKDRWDAFLLRGIAGTMLFWIFLAGGLPAMLEAMKIATPGWLMALSAVINSQAGPPVAYFCGLGVDGALGFVPWLKSHLPEVRTEVSSSVESHRVPGGIQTTTLDKEVVTTPVVPKGT